MIYSNNYHVCVYIYMYIVSLYRFRVSNFPDLFFICFWVGTCPAAPEALSRPGSYAGCGPISS